MRHAIPQTSLRARDSRLDESQIIPAQIHTNDQQARSNKTITQPSIDIESYQSRRAYGARTLTDLTREFGQKGLSDVRAGNSRRTQIAWARAEDGGKPGPDIIPQIRAQIFDRDAESMVDFELMPGPTITVNESEVVGDPDRGDVTAEIETTPFARLRGTQANYQAYVETEGFLRRWVTVDEYDIYA